MKKIIALLLTLAMLFTFTAVLAEAAEEEIPTVGHYQIANLTGEHIVSLTFTDNKDGDSIEYLVDGAAIEPDDVIFVILPVTNVESKEDASHRLTLSFKTAGGYEATFATLSIEDVLINLLAQDALTGATPIQFSTPYQAGYYKIVNNTSKELTTVTFVENADANNNSTQGVFVKPGDFALVGFLIDPDAEGNHALTISFQFEDGTECSFGTLSIEEATLTLSDEDVVSGATPFKFGPLDLSAE